MLHGGERIAWTQAAASFDEVRRYAFVLYDDEQRLPLGDPQCDPDATPGRFECSVLLPELGSGTHTLRLSAVLADRESGRSGPFVVSVPLSSEVTEPLSPYTRAGAPAPGCVADRSVCYNITPLATFGVPVSAPTVAADGRLFFIENGDRVRVIDAKARLVAAPALAVSATRRLITVMLAPGFAQDGAVFLAWVETSNTGQRHLTVAKYRELDNRLGEGRVLVSELLLPPSGDPKVAQDYAGRLYVAMPAAIERREHRSDPYHGAVLRFGDDGMTPWASGQSSPLFARGYAQPVAMVLDGANRLWLGGAVTGRHLGLVWIATEDGRRVDLPVAPLMWNSPDGEPRDLAVVKSDDANAPGELFVISTAGVLSRQLIEPSGVTGPAQAVSLPAGVVPVAVSAGRRRDVYLVVRGTDGAYSILRFGRPG